MNREFIPYEQALELKQLGFDELCIAYYNQWIDISNEVKQMFRIGEVKGVFENITPAPLYQQAFRWFREKYDLFISITHYENGYSINDLRRFDIYEEAQLACLKKLIEIVNTKEK
jgi:predicted GNAT superfamily acetyltransferase